MKIHSLSRLIPAVLVLIAAMAVPGSGPAVEADKGVKTASPAIELTGGPERGTTWPAGFAAVYQTLLKNLRLPSPPFQTRYAYPSPIFKGVYLWDTAFIAQVWKPWDVATAQEITLAVLDHADQGRLQHLVSPYDKSDLTQPPVMAWSAWQLYQWSGDREYLGRAYPTLKAYNQWLYANRRLPNGLFFWKAPYESGIDNSPRFGSADESTVVDVTNLAAVDLSSYVALQNEVLTAMAEELGRGPEAAEFKQKAAELRDRINQLLWDEETGLYYDRDVKSDQLARIKTIASLLPLFAGVPGPERARRLRDHAMAPGEFNTWMPLPSVARDDPSFEKDCWRGPVWINTAYMVVKGLERYGFNQEAGELAYKLVDGVYRNYRLTGQLVEFYDPDQDGFADLHRKRGNLYKKVTLGDQPRPNFVGWTGLVNTLLIEDLVGLGKAPGRRWLAPRFPGAAAGTTVKLTLPGEGVAIELEVLDRGMTRGKVSIVGISREFSLGPGLTLDLWY